MSKYIDADNTSTENATPSGQVENLTFEEYLRGVFEINNGIENDPDNLVRIHAPELLKLARKQEQPIEGKQVIIITETDGDANIHWDCRSLDDVKALLASAQSFIADRQVEELRGQGSGPDYNTTEGRFRNAHKFQQEQPEVDLDFQVFAKEMDAVFNLPKEATENTEENPLNWEYAIARHFYELGLNARKEE